MIITVTPNVALDVTYRTKQWEKHKSNKISDVAERSGGKGINVARVLTELNVDCLALGFQGGVVGGAVAAELEASSINHHLIPIGEQTRKSIAVVDDEDATVFNEAGPRITSPEWRALMAALEGVLPAADAVAVCGSLPPGVSNRQLCELLATIKKAEVPVLLDTSGPALVAALAEQPDVLKPNADEIKEATGLAAPLAGADRLIADGAKAVFVSLGADGMALVLPDRKLIARPSFFVEGNPTGAGDAGVAAILAGIVAGDSWDVVLAHSVALSAAAVAHPLAGGFDPDVHRQMRQTVTAKGLPNAETNS